MWYCNLLGVVQILLALGSLVQAVPAGKGDRQKVIWGQPRGALQGQSLYTGLSPRNFAFAFTGVQIGHAQHYDKYLLLLGKDKPMGAHMNLEARLKDLARIGASDRSGFGGFTKVRTVLIMTDGPGLGDTVEKSLSTWKSEMRDQMDTDKMSFARVPARDEDEDDWEIKIDRAGELTIDGRKWTNYQVSNPFD